MKLVEPKVEVLFAPKYSEAMNLLEVATRNCYDSLDSICHGSAEKIISHIIKNNHHSMLEFLNVTVRITTNRNVLAQLSRHRHITMAVNSQRYINYSKKKYNKELSFIVPEDLDDVQYLTWRAACQQAEDSYMELIEKYHKSTDTARSVLPNCTATTIVMTANIREWRHILELRCDKHASPDMQKIAKMLLKELYLQYPILFKDLMTKFK